MFNVQTTTSIKENQEYCLQQCHGYCLLIGSVLGRNEQQTKQISHSGKPSRKRGPFVWQSPWFP